MCDSHKLADISLSQVYQYWCICRLLCKKRLQYRYAKDMVCLVFLKKAVICTLHLHRGLLKPFIFCDHMSWFSWVERPGVDYLNFYVTCPAEKGSNDTSGRKSMK